MTVQVSDSGVIKPCPVLPVLFLMGGWHLWSDYKPWEYVFSECPLFRNMTFQVLESGLIKPCLLNPGFASFVPYWFCRFCSLWEDGICGVIKNRGIMGVRFFRMPPVEKRGILGLLVSRMTPVWKPRYSENTFFRMPPFGNCGILAILFSRMLPVYKQG